ncbi:MAG: efflux RND transporter periplasmic adaptor subunit [Burkholderiaceae bacterium]|nr:efflux RND transporter periplasmic adaptor subunit [Burkholderiaceae bacterium]
MTDPTRPSGSWRRRTVWLLVLALVLAGLYAAYCPRPLPVEAATATVGRFEQTLSEDGRLRLKHRYVIHAPVSGELLRPTLRVGDPVAQGDAVAELQPLAAPLLDERNRQVLTQRLGSAQAARRAADAQLEQALLQLAQARDDAERAKQLAAQGFTASAANAAAERALRLAEQAVASARAQQDMAAFALSEAQAALANSTISDTSLLNLRSPIDGRVIQLHQDSAGPVSAGEALVTIDNTSSLEAVIDVLSSEVGQIRPDAAVTLSLGRQLPPVEGRVQRVEPVAFTKTSALGIEEQRVNVIVDLLTPLQDGLGEGYRVEAVIELYAEADALIIPTGALVRQGTAWQVLVIEGDRARARRVEVRDRHASLAWITDGLQAGETVVLFPGNLIQDGQRVRVQSQR